MPNNPGTIGSKVVETALAASAGSRSKRPDVS
jgi:hypothetical protein